MPGCTLGCSRVIAIAGLMNVTEVMLGRTVNHSGFFLQAIIGSQ